MFPTVIRVVVSLLAKPQFTSLSGRWPKSPSPQIDSVDLEPIVIFTQDRRLSISNFSPPLDLHLAPVDF